MDIKRKLRDMKALEATECALIEIGKLIKLKSEFYSSTVYLIWS